VACSLAGLSQFDERFVGNTRYWDRAEQIYRGHGLGSMFKVRDDYLELMKKTQVSRIDLELFGDINWEDLTGNGNDMILINGQPKLVEAEFPAGKKPVVSFTGADNFATKTHKLDLETVSLYAVLEVKKGAGGGAFYSNYSNAINWGFGTVMSIMPGGQIYFFTSAGTEATYGQMNSSPISEGYHIVSLTYDPTNKRIYVDGKAMGSVPSKGLKYGGKPAVVGAFLETGERDHFDGGIAEIVISDKVDSDEQRLVERYLSNKYGIAITDSGKIAVASAVDEAASRLKSMALWLKADERFNQAKARVAKAERLKILEAEYPELVKTAARFEGRYLGSSGINDWACYAPSEPDPELGKIGFGMMGCCGDAVIRATRAIWFNTVTHEADVDRTLINMAFNRETDQVTVVSLLPHRGEVDVMVKKARNVLVRIPGWSQKNRVKVYVDKKPAAVKFDQVFKDYVLFENTSAGQQLTVTYPLRIATIKETPGSLDGTEYTQKWRGNTIVDIDPKGRHIPMFNRPELDAETLPKSFQVMQYK
jgi:hypothetical protein